MMGSSRWSIPTLRTEMAPSRGAEQSANQKFHGGTPGLTPLQRDTHSVHAPAGERIADVLYRVSWRCGHGAPVKATSLSQLTQLILHESYETKLRPLSQQLTAVREAHLNNRFNTAMRITITGTISVVQPQLSVYRLATDTLVKLQDTGPTLVPVISRSSCSSARRAKRLALSCAT
jgi:hypothetical protein